MCLKIKRKDLDYSHSERQGLKAYFKARADLFMIIFNQN